MKAWYPIIFISKIIAVFSVGYAAPEVSSQIATVRQPVNGIFLKELGLYHFPRNLWILRGKFEYSRFFSSIFSKLAQLKEELGKYGSSADNTRTIANRRCSTKENGICPLTSVKEISATFGRDLNMVLEIIYTTQKRVTYLRTLLDSISSEIQTEIPALDSSMLRQLAPWNIPEADSAALSDIKYDLTKQIAYLPFSDKFNARIWDEIYFSFALNDRSRPEFPTSTLEVTASIQDIICDTQVAMLHVNLYLEQHIGFLHSLSIHEFPLNMYENAVLESSVSRIFSTLNPQELSVQEQTLLQFPLHNRLTFVVRNTSCLDSSSTTRTCPDIDIFTLLPIPTKQTSFILNEAIVLPFASASYLESLKWQQHELSARYFLKNDYAQFAIRNLSDFSCLQQLSPSFHHLCFFSRIQPAELTTCDISLLRWGHNTSVCPASPVEDPSESSIQVGHHDWLFTDPTPGTLSERCPTSSNIFKLPSSGLLHFKDACEYPLIDGPFSHVTPYIPGVSLTISDSTVLPKRTIVTDFHAVKNHFHEYGYIYVITLTSFLIPLILVSLYLYVSHRRTRPRVIPRRRRQRRRIADPDIALIPSTSRSALLQIRFVPGGVQIGDV